jgi:hypothetical protein
VAPEATVPRGTLFSGVSYSEVLDTDPQFAKEVWGALGGPRSTSRKLITDPMGQTKGRKSVAPQYMLHLMPHRQAAGLQESYLEAARPELRKLGLDVATGVKLNLCKHSTSGCRRHCLVSAGRGGSPAVINGRLFKTLLATQFPTLFLALLRHELLLIARRKPNAWFRPNGTSDIPWEMMPATRAIMEEVGLQYGDYTKYTPEQRPKPQGLNYSLARSMWPGRDTPDQAVALLRAGHHVSIVVDDVTRLEGVPGVIEADKTDEWVFGDPVIGALTPKGSLKRDPRQVFRSEDILRALQK